MSRLLRRKNNNNTGARNSGPTNKKQKTTVDLGWSKNDNDDEHIDSEEDDEDYNKGQKSLEDDEDEEEEETLDAKKVRLARAYLKKIEARESDESSNDEEEDEDETEHDRVGTKLQRERLKLQGTWERAVADSVNTSLTQMRQDTEALSVASSVENEAKEWIQSGQVKLLRGHDLTPTCVALLSSGEKAISGSKDHSVILWDVEQERKDIVLCPTWKRDKDADVSRTNGEVLSVACSDDGRYAAVGRRDATVSIFDIRSGKNNLVKTFTGHKGPITCLGFRSQSLQMFSGSEDRCIR
jgi:ribosomal RNA-processing protein 9